jgi:hypothetical protein
MNFVTAFVHAETNNEEYKNDGWFRSIYRQIIEREWFYKCSTNEQL